MVESGARIVRSKSDPERSDIGRFGIDRDRVAERPFYREIEERNGSADDKDRGGAPWSACK